MHAAPRLRALKDRPSEGNTTVTQPIRDQPSELRVDREVLAHLVAQGESRGRASGLQGGVDAHRASVALAIAVCGLSVDSFAWTLTAM